MKRLILLTLALSLALSLCLTSASATILAAEGIDLEFYSWTGLDCTPAVILCENLTVYDARGDQGGKKATTLHYTGETIPVIQSWDGWAEIYYSDGTKTGWVHSEYLLMDPQWYVCDQGMPAYAYPDTSAPRVGYLATDTRLPIITESNSGSGYGWVCVSLRGAAAWLRKTAADTVVQTTFDPAMMTTITGALLTIGGQSVYTNAPESLNTLRTLLSNADLQNGPAGCSFGATLEVELADGQRIILQLATDSCCVYRVNGHDYAYARNLVSWDGAPDNSVLFELFGVVNGVVPGGNG